MVTTIQLNFELKNQLDKLKINRETYEDVILRLMKMVEKNNREKEQLLIEGCRATAEENLNMTKEFAAIEDLKDWKW